MLTPTVAREASGAVCPCRFLMAELPRWRFGLIILAVSNVLDRAGRVFGHSGRSLALHRRIGELPATTIFHPAAFVAWKTRSICRPCQKIRDRIRQRRLVRSMHSESSLAWYV